MSIHFEKDADNIVTLTIDMPGRSSNVLNHELIGPMAAAIDAIEADPAIAGVILTSGKKEFLVGADIEELFRITAPQQAFGLSQEFKALLRRLERCGRPLVAALNGSALGGGLELALACHYRIAIGQSKAKFGLPEVKLGLLPGGGGTQRLPRLLGIQNALPLLLEGKELNAEQALQQGILHALVSGREDMMAAAKAWCLANPHAAQPWDDKKFRWPGGDAKSPANAQLWSIAPSMASAKTYGNYPAAINILSCVFEGGIVDFDTGCEIESRYFANCAMSPAAKNMIGTLWFQLNAINKGKSRPAGFPVSVVKKIGVLGAGMMGAGIAYVSAKAGIDVVLLDVSAENAEKGKAYSAVLLDKAIQRGRETADGKQAILARIEATADIPQLAGCELVIEAVFEDRQIKAEITRKVEAILAENAVFASNTSTLPITGLSQASARPGNFIGLHFFSPVDKMPLVEIIVGAKTSSEMLARSFDFVQQIKKTPIVVNDARGFYTSRVFGTYLMEGLKLLMEGQHPRAIEMAGLQAGMPVGPLALHDEVSLSLSWHILEQSRKDFAVEGKPFSPHPASAGLQKMVTELERCGKKAGKGFYDYPANETKHLWPGLQQAFPLAPQQLPQQDLIERLMFVQANEAAKCFEEKVVLTVADANIGSIFGWGFAPFQGGALQYINAYGIGNFVGRARELAERHGDCFAPAALLVTMAQNGARFE
jgi:3-hydroxyacyl-CoA dehydrogenase / enoyl-CoA hydratase / 3-hydroxybutyryl-CoA epimerase